jgi:quercetin dioxygenase-like cupin family protein
MTETYLHFDGLDQPASLPENGILSRTLQNDERSKVIHFVFAPGTELSAHTAPTPATLCFLAGEAVVKLGSDTKEARAGTFIYMAPKLEHGIQAKTQVVMLLTMLKNPA